jgi:hypothetical protein
MPTPKKPNPIKAARAPINVNGKMYVVVMLAVFAGSLFITCHSFCGVSKIFFTLSIKFITVGFSYAKCKKYF